MTMLRLTEGKLTFEFPAGWETIKFDDTAYYREYLEAINGLKAADFIATYLVRSERRLLFVEVKDCRLDEAELQQKIRTEHFPLEVVLKVLHTLNGLYLLTHLTDSAQRRFAALAPFQKVVADHPHRLEVVLLLEQAPIKPSPHASAYKERVQNRNAQRAGIRKRLTNALKPLGFACLLLDTVAVQTEPRLGWSVTAA